MAMTREQADKIEIDEDVIVGFSGSVGDICAEQLARWAYRRLETWPALLATCKDFIFLEKTNMTKKQVQLRIDIAKGVIAKYDL